jgi:hypothetical protein
MRPPTDRGERRVAAEVASLLTPHPKLGLPIPSYGGRCVANVSVSILEATGGEGRGLPPLLPPLDRALDPFGDRRAPGPVVQFLIDGIGFSRFVEWCARSRNPLGAVWGRLARPITTVFPSTTTTALCSISTGSPPGRHGLVGYRQYLPRYGVVADILKMTPAGFGANDALVGAEWQPSDISGAPTLFRRGLNATALSRDRFANSGFTRLLYDGAQYVPYSTAADLAHELHRLLSRSRPPPAIFVYWDELDTIQHLRGPSPELFDLELSHLAGLVEFVSRHLTPRRRATTTLLVTGDHGQVSATAAARVELDALPDVVREMSRPLTGDRRAGFLSAREGRVPALTRALRPHLPRGTRIVPIDSAIGAGLFGPPPFHPELRQRVGDLLVLPPSPAALTYRPPGVARPRRFLLGAHGGLEPEELVVPLIAGPLESFRGDS